MKLSLALALLVLLAGCQASLITGAPVSVAVVNGRVWTGNLDQPWAEAVAIQGDSIAKVGSDQEIRALLDERTQMIDAKGGLVCPGFIDSHAHFIEGGRTLSSVQLRDAKTPEEFTARLEAFARTLPPGEWITGGLWDHTLWGGELPRRDWIDGVTPDNPVWVERLDGHMALANSLALEKAGVSRETPDIPGGTIVRDAKGQPTGILKDNAQSLVNRAVPEPSDEAQDRALRAAMAHVAAQGVTSVHAMTGGWEKIAVYEKARAAGALRTRIYAIVPLSSWERLRDHVERSGPGDAWLRMGALKGFVDGSLGSHTAAFHEDYDDRPGDKGLLVNTREDLYKWISGADAAGLHVAVHAIGDRAISMLLEIYEQVIGENGPRDRRFRVEHAQHIAPMDIPRFAQLGVIASIQPYHAIDDGRWTVPLIGVERSRTTHAYHSLLEHGATMAFGSDWPVAPPTPIEGIYGAVTRRTLDDKNPDGWFPEQKITVEEALWAYTVGAARASFEEDVKGSLEPGKLADLVVLDRDLTAMEPAAIRAAAVVLTMVGGEVIYRRD